MGADENPFKYMSDDDVTNAVRSAINDIRNTEYKYGEIVIVISGGRVKHVNVMKPWKDYNQNNRFYPA